jgi:hypothetical protein
MKKPTIKILLNALPLLLMILLIPYVQNDYLLLIAYILIISILLLIRYEPEEYIYFIFGLTAITFFEWVFVSTGAEIFLRKSFLGIMPIWLPFLWAYSFIVIKRCIMEINNHLYEKT